MFNKCASEKQKNKNTQRPSADHTTLPSTAITAQTKLLYTYMTAEMHGGRSEAAGGGRRAGAVCGAGVKVRTLCSSRCRAGLPESRHKQSYIHVRNTILYRGGQGSEAGTCVVQKTTNTAPAQNTPPIALALGPPAPPNHTGSHSTRA